MKIALADINYQAIKLHFLRVAIQINESLSRLRYDINDRICENSIIRTRGWMIDRTSIQTNIHKKCVKIGWMSQVENEWFCCCCCCQKTTLSMYINNVLFEEKQSTENFQWILKIHAHCIIFYRTKEPTTKYTRMIRTKKN